MSKGARIALSIGIGLTVMVITVYAMAFFMRQPVRALAIGLGFVGWIVSYQVLKPSKEEVSKNTKRKVENHHDNGIVKERGIMIGEIKEGDWEYFNNEGILVSEIGYVNGEEVARTDY